LFDLRCPWMMEEPESLRTTDIEERRT
jgi:hypothetical protein